MLKEYRFVRTVASMAKNKRGYPFCAHQLQLLPVLALPPVRSGGRVADLPERCEQLRQSLLKSWCRRMKRLGRTIERSVRSQNQPLAAVSIAAPGACM